MSLSLQYQQLALEDEGNNKSSLAGAGGKDEFVVLEVGTVAPPNTPNNEEEQEEIDWLDEDADDCGKAVVTSSSKSFLTTLLLLHSLIRI